MPERVHIILYMGVFVCVCVCFACVDLVSSVRVMSLAHVVCHFPDMNYERQTFLLVTQALH